MEGEQQKRGMQVLRRAESSGERGAPLLMGSSRLLECPLSERWPELQGSWQRWWQRLLLSSALRDGQHQPGRQGGGLVHC